ncbi:MAG TPA: phosphate signaling complex protein PhoU [Candidatus Blautia intestinipullorum]|nr:phosphate signaling complex protein PhoU [Candidatus Blautia intestinipullorum]
MATRFERQLEELHVQMITMGSLCEKVITLSAKTIEGEDCVKEVFDTDKEIDAKEREIETLCMRLLLHQQPVAGDLREISAALRMISDMERIGDQAADIADLSRFIDKNCAQIPDEIKKMVEQTVHMVTESVDSFVKSDINLCRKVISDDDKVDEAFNKIKEELASLIHNNMDVKVGLDLLMAAKYMERIGDHAVNIAEWVEYSITGVHRNNEHQLGGN